MLRCALAAFVAAASSQAQTGPDTAISWTPEEKAFIAAHPVIKVGYAFDPPYNFRDSEGKLVGLDIDYLALLGRHIGLRFEHVQLESWPAAVAEFKAGRVDMITTLALIPEREAWLVYTRPYTSAPNVIVTRNDTPYLIDLRQLKGRRVGVARDNAGLVRAIRTQSPDCVLVEFATTADTLLAVADGEVEAAVEDVVSASWAIRARRLTNLRLGSVIGGSEADHFGVRRDLPLLAQILDKALDALTPIERREIDDRWIAIDVVPGPWVRAVKIAVGAVAVMAVLWLVAFFYNRRLARELEERRRMQLALADAHQKLARASEEKSSILHMVAHDLRTPLHAMQLGVELLEGDRPRLAEVGRETLTRLDETLRQMSVLVDDLVDLNALEAGRRDYRPSELDICGVVRDAAAAFGEAAARKEIRLAVQLEEPAMRLRTDARAVRQVVDNLVSNALKYSPARSEVRIGLGRRDGVCRIQVADRGPGVKPEEREKIFEKYASGSAQPTGGEKATGLGLWIVRRVVIDLRGKVWCESGPEGTGASFVVELPFDRGN